jgi:hypothetical protein
MGSDTLLFELNSSGRLAVGALTIRIDGMEDATAESTTVNDLV